MRKEGNCVWEELEGVGNIIKTCTKLSMNFFLKKLIKSTGCMHSTQKTRKRNISSFGTQVFFKTAI